MNTDTELSEMNDAERSTLHELLVEYGSRGVMLEIAAWLDEDRACQQMASTIRSVA